MERLKRKMKKVMSIKFEAEIRLFKLFLDNLQ